MYAGVPRASPVSVSRSSPAAVTARAMPKSATTACVAIQQDVLRLDVAMDDAVRVRVAQRAQHLASRSGSPRPGKAGRSRASRWRRDSPSTYGIVYQSLPAASPGVVHGQDVRMLEAGGDPDLAEEALRPE